MKICPKCGVSITRDGLAGGQFFEDMKKLNRDGIPMK